MAIVAVTGDHPRHAYLVSQIACTGMLAGWVRERREAFIPEPDVSLSPDLRALFIHHFARRNEAEEKAFGAADDHAIECDILDVTLDELNSQRTVDFIRGKSAKFLISYGCHKLEPQVLEACNGYAWNCHGGLSPQYRGVHTHFWPSYMLEPQMTGVTLHETTEAIDGGGIIHQTGVTLVRGDGLHDLACRAVREFAQQLPDVLLKAAAHTGSIKGAQQTTTGRIWTTGMWRPEHLIPIYKHYQDSIVDLCLAGDIVGRLPNLVTLEGAMRGSDGSATSR